MSALVGHFRAMARNNLWSNCRPHKACAQLSPQDYVSDRGAFFRSIHGTLNHILLIDRFYTATIAGGHAESGRLDRELYPDLPSLTAPQAQADRELLAICDRLTQPDVEVVARWADLDGNICEDPIRIVLSHLFVHQIHHRGQVHNMLSGLRLEPPQT